MVESYLRSSVEGPLINLHKLIDKYQGRHVYPKRDFAHLADTNSDEAIMDRFEMRLLWIAFDGAHVLFDASSTFWGDVRLDEDGCRLYGRPRRLVRLEILRCNDSSIFRRRRACQMEIAVSFLL